jgi:hypothetical protein
MNLANPVQPKAESLVALAGLVNEVSETSALEARVRAALAAAGNVKDWQKVWNIADLLGVEISLLFDSANNIWVDIGTPGSVRLQPPTGAILPFQLWVHTHPRDAYWSATDRRTLAIWETLLDEALVLGHDHYKRATKSETIELPRLSSTGPLASWSDEEIVQYLTGVRK